MVGLTTKLPKNVPQCLEGSDAGPHEWIFDDDSLFHNGNRRDFRGLPSLNDLTPGQSVGLRVTHSGQLHLFVDDELRWEITTGLPVDTPMWGVADLYDRCTKIKSELMSESSGVVISPSQCVGEELD